MNIASLSRSKPIRALGSLLASAAAVFVIGLLNPPAIPMVQAASTTPPPVVPVAVDQQPLTLRPQVPPDITLMLDDSGSMNWDFMPDAGYLSGSFTATDEFGYSSTYVNIDSLRNSAANGTYYNPNVTYKVPPLANGSTNPLTTGVNPTPTGLASAYDNPFSSTPKIVDVTQNLSPWLCDYNPNNPYVQYTTTATSTTTYCPASLQYTFPYYTAFPSSTTGTGNAYKLAASCPSGATLMNGFCFPSTGSVSKPFCSGADTYNPATGYCEKTVIAYTYLFTYMDPATGSKAYVGKSATDCGFAPAGSSCVFDSATQQNVAIWFSYYRTRILMAKSGLMLAFKGLDPAFRVGFGSINGNNSSGLPAGSQTFNSQQIAQVAPFGKPTDVGSQRINFWNWVTGESANGGTPLRMALDAVGQYYKSSQPWTTMSSDPVPPSTAPLACRQAYTILTTDGFWNENYSSLAENGASSAPWPAVTGPNSQKWPATSGSSPAAPYSGGGASPGPSLADVAMYYWENDLQSSISNEVPTSTQDPAFWQHMTTFTMGLGFAPSGISPAGTTIPQIFDWAIRGTAPSTFSWPTPASNSINNIADLAHAAVNGHGGFFSATNPESFVSGIRDALNRTKERVGTGASLAANSTQLQTGTAVFQANYYTAVWKGDLKELAVSSTGAIANAPTWSAAANMPGAASRTITSYNTSTGKFVAFQNSGAAPPGMSAAQLAALDPSGAGNTANEVAVVNYLRGDQSQEQKNGGNFRTREWVLGDIVDSQPVYVGAPNANEFVGRTFAGYTYDPTSTTPTANASPFNDWAVGTTDSSGNFTPSAASKRTPLVWVAANDGMLHAFNASSGVEVYAYLPGALMVNSTDPYLGTSTPLAKLTDPNYGTGTVPHQFYNDGELTVAEAYIQTPGAAAVAWHTILVGTTGRGPARAVYALDVTDPANITPMWERYAGDTSTYDTNSIYIGQMVGKPVIAQTGDYGSTAGPAWSVLIGNGYNSPGNGSNIQGGTAALLQFDLATGKLYAHPTDTNTANGLAAPVAWQDAPSSGMNDIAYAGDLLGRMWAFPLINVTTNNQTNVVSYTPTPTASGSKLFTATDGTALNKAQPITGGTTAGLNPLDRSVWVFFGTGKYLTQSDIISSGGVINKDVQSWYGIQVQPSPGGGNTLTPSRTTTTLVQRQIIAETLGSDTQLGLRAVTPRPATSDMTGKNGWYIDLLSPLPNGVTSPTAQGERVVLPNQFQGNLVLTTTRIPLPNASTNTDPCNPSGGGWIMAVDPFTGTDPATNFFDTTGSGSIGSKDMITLSNGQQVAAAGVGYKSLPNAPIFVGNIMLVSFDNGKTASDATAGSTGGYSRASWREMVIP